MRQPKIFLRINNKFETKDFKFGAIIYFKSWAERIGADRCDVNQPLWADV
jgi:hypothetical protein